MGFFAALAIATVVSALIKKKSDDKARKDAKDFRNQLLGVTSVEEFLRTTKALRPQFRELVASGIGPSIQSSIATRVARAGGSKTGIGIAAGNIGSVLPEIEAIRQASAAAQNIQRNRAAVLSGQSPLHPSGTGEFLQTLADLGQTFFANKALGKSGVSPSLTRAIPVIGGVGVQ